MDIQDILKIKDESERVNALYNIFNEDNRLNSSKASSVEYVTTLEYIERYAAPNCRILELGAGTGAYSLYLAAKGYDVTALELADRNIDILRKRAEESSVSLHIVHGNAMDLSDFASESFDIVLLLGPLYHLQSAKDRGHCIDEALRVCTKDGMLFCSFISNDMVILTEFDYRPDFFISNTYDHDTFKVVDFPFVFLTVEQANSELSCHNMDVIHRVASDGVSELMADKINAMDDESFKQYLRYHFYCCEKPEMLGRSNHLLYIGKKR